MSPTPTPDYVYTSSGNTIWRCAMPQALSGNVDPALCIDSNATALAGARGWVFDSTGSRAYIPNNDANSVTVCDVENFFFTNCRNSGATSLNFPRGIDFFNGYALIVNGFNTPVVTKCTHNAADGSLSACTNSGATNIDQPWSIQVTTEYGGDFAYVAARRAGNVVKCSIAANASLSGCTTYSTGFATPVADMVNFVHVFNGTAYVSYSTTTVYRTTVSYTDGALGTFINAGATLLNNGTVIGLRARLGNLYITKNQNPGLVRCTIGTGGALSGCVNTGSSVVGYMSQFLPVY